MENIFIIAEEDDMYHSSAFKQMDITLEDYEVINMNER